jgi:hypothetical protein
VHRFINCPYLFIKVYKLGWNLKLKVKKKVKEALIKASNRIKRALKQAKVKLKKKNSTFTLIFKSPFTTINKLSNFVI